MIKILYIPTYNKITDIDRYFYNKKELSEKNPDLIIVSGGDGSLLHAIQSYKDLNVPFLGIAAGTRNFLMKDMSLLNIRNIQKINDINNLNMINIHTLSVSVNRVRTNGTENIIFKSSFINDIVVGGSIMDFNSFQFDNTNIKGMGLILSTPLGSTAFNANIDNEIIQDLKEESVMFSSIACENNFSNKINFNEIPEIQIKSERNAVKLFVDGTTKIFDLKYGDIIKVIKDTQYRLID